MHVWLLSRTEINQSMDVVRVLESLRIIRHERDVNVMEVRARMIKGMRRWTTKQGNIRSKRYKKNWEPRKRRWWRWWRWWVPKKNDHEKVDNDFKLKLFRQLTSQSLNDSEIVFRPSAVSASLIKAGLCTSSLWVIGMCVNQNKEVAEIAHGCTAPH